MFQFIDAERANHPVAIMCRVLEVSRSGFYAWGRRSASARSRADRALAERVTEVHGASRRTYGAPRIHAMLAREGTRVGRKRVARLMKEHGIEGVSRRRGRRSLTKSDPKAAPAPDRVSRQFSAEGPNQLWVTDITYIATSEGWLYLAIVVDMWSRRIVGWSMRDDMSAPLVVDALQMGTTRRRPEAGCIAHSDRGSQYTSVIYGNALKASGLDASMGKRGCAYDNAACESVMSTIKTEIDTINRGRPHPGRRAARLAVFDYIEAFYNRLRLHSALGYLSPEEFELHHAAPGEPVEMPGRGRASGPTPGPWTALRADHITTGSATIGLFG